MDFVSSRNRMMERMKNFSNINKLTEKRRFFRKRKMRTDDDLFVCILCGEWFIKDDFMQLSKSQACIACTFTPSRRN